MILLLFVNRFSFWVTLFTLVILKTSLPSFLLNPDVLEHLWLLIVPGAFEVVTWVETPLFSSSFENPVVVGTWVGAAMSYLVFQGVLVFELCLWKLSLSKSGPIPLSLLRPLILKRLYMSLSTALGRRKISFTEALSSSSLMSLGWLLKFHKLASSKLATLFSK